MQKNMGGLDCMSPWVFLHVNKSEMFVNRIEKVHHCISDQWKLWITAYLDSQPDLKELAETLNARYSESLGIVLVHMGRRMVIFFECGKVTTRANDIEEGSKKEARPITIKEEKEAISNWTIIASKSVFSFRRDPISLFTMTFVSAKNNTPYQVKIIACMDHRCYDNACQILPMPQVSDCHGGRCCGSYMQEQGKKKKSYPHH